MRRRIERTRTGAAAGGDFVFLFGGERGNAQLISTDSSSVVTSGPTLGSWNSLGASSVVTRRSFEGCTQESAFFFLAGGRTAR